MFAGRIEVKINPVTKESEKKTRVNIKSFDPNSSVASHDDDMDSNVFLFSSIIKPGNRDNLAAI